MKRNSPPDSDRFLPTSRQPSDPERVAQLVRNACIDAARNGFTDASIQGLCQEGAMEAAISAIERLDLPELLKKNPF